MSEEKNKQFDLGKSKTYGQGDLTEITRVGIGNPTTLTKCGQF